MAGQAMGIDVPIVGSKPEPSGMGINGPSHRSLGGKMGMDLRPILDEAPSESPEVEFEDTGDVGYDNEEGDPGGAGDSDDLNSIADDHLEPEVEEESKPESESQLIRKLRMSEDDRSKKNKEIRRLTREIKTLQDSAGRQAPSLDKRDPASSIARMLRETLGEKATDQEIRHFIKETATDMLVDADDALGGKDPNLKNRREQRRAQQAIQAEREELMRMADEAKAERQRLQEETRAAAHDEIASREINKFWSLESARYPYLAVRTSAASELREVLDEMADSGEWNFGDPRRVAEGFRLGAARLDAYHRQEAEIYGRVKAAPKAAAPAQRERQTGRQVPGKNVARGQTTTARMASRGGTRTQGGIANDDEPANPRMKFGDFVDNRRHEERAAKRGR